MKRNPRILKERVVKNYNLFDPLSNKVEWYKCANMGTHHDIVETLISRSLNQDMKEGMLKHKEQYSKVWKKKQEK